MELRKIEWALLVLATLVFLSVWHIRQRKLHPLRRNWPPPSVYLFSIVIVGFVAAYAYYEEQWYRGKIAPLIDIDEPVFTSSPAGFRGGCGVGVFKLSSEARTEILQRGMREAGEVVRNSSATTVGIGGWQKTPFVTAGDETSLKYRWLVGIACANMSLVLQKAVHSALSEPGSYTTTMGDEGVIVLPEKGLVVFSFSN